MKIAFVGTGMIGGGLAVDAALNGNDVTLYDVADIETVKASIKSIFDIMVEAEACTKEAADKAFAGIKYTQDLKEAVTGAEFIQECVPERIELKRDTYKQIQEIVGDSAIISSSTTGIFPSVLVEGALYPEKIVVGHPYNPSYIVPLVEICGPHAPEEVIQKTVETYKAMGKEPVVCLKEVDGFIANSLSWAVMGGAMKEVEAGVCSVEDADKAIMYGPGLRMAATGQLLTMSLGIQGGFRQMSAKYGHSDEHMLKVENMIADGIDEEVANRPDFMGHTVEEITKYRDKTIVSILKLHKKL